ncbi:MAG TPA: D-aminoacyl-tRNA deacylase [Ornithinicoccus sp.]|nr:D-aminoacyl-tRNA deacylase [Ornithinicoccus sp.]
MRAVLQRVSRASVVVGGEVVGAIGRGLVALVAATHDDGPDDVERMARKIAELRILPDETSVADTASAAVLVVSQFTLYGDTRKGRRPGWSHAAPGPVAEPLVEGVVQALRARGIEVATGVFGAQMQVELVNDGPFTVLVDT